MDREDEPYGKILAYSIHTCVSLLLASFGVSFSGGWKALSRRLLLDSVECMKRTARSLGGNFDIDQQNTL